MGSRVTLHNTNVPFLNGTNGLVVGGPDAETGAFRVKCQQDNTERMVAPASMSSFVPSHPKMAEALSGALDVEELEVCSNKSFQYCGKILLYKMYQRCY